jgi:Ni/Fe-hydrogenase subunit HybB-like protein
MKVYHLIFAAILIHLSLVIYTLHDLLFTSKRRNKLRWGIMITLLPAIGAIAYEVSKKRPRY